MALSRRFSEKEQSFQCRMCIQFISHSRRSANVNRLSFGPYPLNFKKCCGAGSVLDQKLTYYCYKMAIERRRQVVRPSRLCDTSGSLQSFHPHQASTKLDGSISFIMQRLAEDDTMAREEHKKNVSISPLKLFDGHEPAPLDRRSAVDGHVWRRFECTVIVRIDEKMMKRGYV